MGAAAARLLRAVQGRSSTRSEASSSARDFTTEATDEVCSLGHPMVIRLGRNGRFLACSLYPEHKESRPLPGEERRRSPEPARRRRGLPEVRCDRRRHPRRPARPVRAVRRLLALPRLQLHQEGRPAAARAAAVRGHLPAVRRGPPDAAPRAPHRARLFWGCSRYPKCDFTTSHEPLGAAPRRRRGPGRPQAARTARCA